MMLSKKFLVALMATSSILSSPVVGVEPQNLRGLGKTESKDGPVTGGAIEPSKQNHQEPCTPGKNVFTNAGTGGKVTTGFKRTSQSRRMDTTHAINTSQALADYKKEKYYQFGRSLQSGLKYMWEDPNYVDSCYDYDIIIGFAELDPTYCKGPGGDQRIFSVNVNVGGGPKIDIVENLNVASATGDCYRAYTVKKTVTPKNKEIQIQFNKGKGSNRDGDPMVSFIAIQRQANRRLGSKCDQDNQKELPSEPFV